MKPLRFVLAALLCAAPLSAVHAESSGDYVPETDPLVVRTLEQWQDWKFGFMRHWGPYSPWGVVESWAICSEDGAWGKRPEGEACVDDV